MREGFMFKSKNEIKEFKGFKLNEPVILTGVCTPKTIGKITRIAPDHLAGNEMAFEVTVNNEFDNDMEQKWYPIYLNELKKA
jgi:hypothetical protein